MAFKKAQLRDIMDKLAANKLVFGLEGDFKYNLAKEIENSFHPDRIYYEYEFIDVKDLRTGRYRRKAFDLVIVKDGKKTVIEAKYKTASVGDPSVYDNKVLINKNGAYPQCRHDFLEDIQRLERIVPTEKDVPTEPADEYEISPDTNAKFAIFLSNEPKLWKEKPNPKNIDAEFRIYDGCDVGPGDLKWNGGTMVKKHPNLKLKGKYHIDWYDYFDLNSYGGKYDNSRFLYTIVEVK